MRKYGIMAVAGLVGFLVTRFVLSPPGMQSWLEFVGTVAAIGGGALGIPAHNASAGRKVLFVVVALVVFLGAVIAFRSVVAGEPGSPAANILLGCAIAMFVPIGFLVELLGLKLTDNGNGG